MSILLAVFCLLHPEEIRTATRADVISSVLNFTDNQFFSAGRGLLDSRESLLLDTDFSGIVINAPRVISAESHGKLPIIMASRLNGRRAWEARLRDNCILMGANLRDGTVLFADALAGDLKGKRPAAKKPKGPMPSQMEQEEYGAQLTELDARSVLDIPWVTGTWAFTVLYYDWASNTVTVTLKGKQKEGQAHIQPVSPEYNPRGAGALPCYLPGPKTPKVPREGLTFAVDASPEKGRQRLIVTGAFAVPVSDFHLPRQRIVHGFSDGRKEEVSAVIPVTMAVLALDSKTPLQFDWAVPVYGAQLRAGMPAHGYFAIDALATGSTPLLNAGSYICYLVVDGRIFGPLAFEMAAAKQN